MSSIIENQDITGNDRSFRIGEYVTFFENCFLKYSLMGIPMRNDSHEHSSNIRIVKLSDDNRWKIITTELRRLQERETLYNIAKK